MIKDPVSNEYVTVNSVSIFSERTGEIVTILDILSLSWEQRNYFVLSQVSGVKLLSRVWLFATPWTVAYQVPLSMGFSRQEYWSGLPFPSPFIK